MQLRHVPTETTWENVVEHGYIAIFDVAGKELLRRDGFQHNRKLRNGGAYDANAIKEIVDEATAALPKKATETGFKANVDLNVNIEAKASAGAA